MRPPAYCSSSRPAAEYRFLEVLGRADDLKPRKLIYQLRAAAANLQPDRLGAQSGDRPRDHVSTLPAVRAADRRIGRSRRSQAPDDSDRPAAGAAAGIDPAAGRAGSTSAL